MIFFAIRDSADARQRDPNMVLRFRQRRIFHQKREISGETSRRRRGRSCNADLPYSRHIPRAQRTNLRRPKRHNRLRTARGSHELHVHSVTRIALNHRPDITFCKPIFSHVTCQYDDIEFFHIHELTLGVSGNQSRHIFTTNYNPNGSEAESASIWTEDSASDRVLVAKLCCLYSLGFNGKQSTNISNKRLPVTLPISASVEECHLVTPHRMSGRQKVVPDFRRRNNGVIRSWKFHSNSLSKTAWPVTGSERPAFFSGLRQ